MSDVANSKIHEVAAEQLAVNREIEHGEIPHLMGALQMEPDGPDLLR